MFFSSIVGHLKESVLPNLEENRDWLFFFYLRIFRKSAALSLFFAYIYILSREVIFYRYAYKYLIDIMHHLQVGHDYRHTKIGGTKVSGNMASGTKA